MGKNRKLRQKSIYMPKIEILDKRLSFDQTFLSKIEIWPISEMLGKNRDFQKFCRPVISKTGTKSTTYYIKNSNRLVTTSGNYYQTGLITITNSPNHPKKTPWIGAYHQILLKIFKISKKNVKNTHLSNEKTVRKKVSHLRGTWQKTRPRSEKKPKILYQASFLRFICGFKKTSLKKKVSVWMSEQRCNPCRCAQIRYKKIFLPKKTFFLKLFFLQLSKGDMFQMDAPVYAFTWVLSSKSSFFFYLTEFNLLIPILINVITYKVYTRKKCTTNPD